MTFLTAAEYTPEQTDLIRTTTLTAATLLGDYMEDLAVVGGLVPSLLIPQTSLPDGVDAHPGTMDLDLGLDLAILDDRRYEGIGQRLRDAGFGPDTSAKGYPVRQRWIHSMFPAAKIEFLIPPAGVESEPGKSQNLEFELAAFIIEGLEVAFNDPIILPLHGTTLFGENASRQIPVCNPGAFVILKALAFRNRGKFKDAYDLFYMVRNYGDGIEAVAGYLSPLKDTDPGRQAIAILREDFLDEKGLGPMRAALFYYGAQNEELQADVVGSIAQLLRLIGAL